MDSFSGIVALGIIALLVMVAAVVYFLPTILALARDHPNAVAIFVLNLFLGWTLLGWVGALVWASTAVPQPRGVGR